MKFTAPIEVDPVSPMHCTTEDGRVCDWLNLEMDSCIAFDVELEHCDTSDDGEDLMYASYRRCDACLRCEKEAAP